MKIKLITIGTKMPNWVQQGYQEYARRLPQDCALELLEIAMPERKKSSVIAKLQEQEGIAMLKQVRANDTVVALDERGKAWTTQQLAQQLNHWRHQGQDLALLVGGPDGLSPACKQRAQQTWSLSPLTLPHPMVRVLLAETLYRAWSVTQNHPYHRQ